MKRVTITRNKPLKADIETENRPIELIYADRMLIHMKELKEGMYPVNQRQVELLKEWWWELHNYDKYHEYTFNDDYTKIKKNVKN